MYHRGPFRPNYCLCCLCTCDTSPKATVVFYRLINPEKRLFEVVSFRAELSVLVHVGAGGVHTTRPSDGRLQNPKHCLCM